MLTHNYQAAMDKLQALVNQGKQSATSVIEHVINNQPTDRIVRGRALNFHPTATGIGVNLDAVVDETIHRNALNQMAQDVDMPMKFLDSLADDKASWAKALLAHNLNTIFHERFPGKRNLARSVNGQIRGFLSDQYRRLDSRPIVEAFASAAHERGALPYEGIVTDTKISIRAIMPEIFEPVPGELIAYGLALENSDFGNGALSLRAYILRMWCNNLAITEETMRQIHLGQRLADNIVYSQRTYELDTKTTVSALKDVTKLQLNADNLRTRMDAVKATAGQAVTNESAEQRLKRILNKGEAEKALDAFKSKDVYNLPEGQNVWRLSNAISWIAGQTEDVERKLALNKIAGEVLKKAA